MRDLSCVQPCPVCDNVQVCKLLLFFSPCLGCPVRGSRPGKNVQLSEGEIRGLCLKSREIFLNQPILLELEAPLKICGEFHETDFTPGV